MGGVLPSFQTKVLMVPPVGGNNFGIIPPNCIDGLASMLRQCGVFLFFFYKERLLFGAPLNVFAILARSGINRVGPLLPRYTILRFGKICPSV